MVTLLDSYGTANRDDYNNAGPASFWHRGQSFMTPNNGVNYKIVQAQFYTQNTGAVTGNAYARLFAHAGVYGVSSVNNGAVLGSSDAYDVSTIPNAWTLITMSFVGVEQYQMTANTHYVILFDGEGLSGNIQVGADYSAPAHGGNTVTTHTDETGHAEADHEIIFYIYGEAPSTAKPSGGGNAVAMMMSTTLKWLQAKSPTIKLPRLSPRTAM